jgi:hypothetical protein
LAPFPFTLSGIWTSCPVCTTEACTRSISFFASGWSAINFSCLSRNEESRARQRVWRCVTVARAMSLKHSTLSAPTYLVPLWDELHLCVTLTTTYVLIHVILTNDWLHSS